MDLEFHYYLTYLIAARAGFSSDDSLTIAYSCQYVDDNDIIFTMDKGKASEYTNYISQTMDINKPKKKLMRIYPLFHFYPGEPNIGAADRKDGKLHWLNTSPNSKNVNDIFDDALSTRNLFRIGIAAHTYADTWAHQNFVGYFESFNGMGGVLEAVSPNIGHADAGYNPDWPALVWLDKRLISEGVDNKTRFLEAAEKIFYKFRKHLAPTEDAQISLRDCIAMLNDLRTAIGQRDQSNRYVKDRIERYRALANQREYGGRELSTYDMDTWFLNAVGEKVYGIRDRTHNILTRFDPFTDTYEWLNKATYQNSDWYRFQEAVRDHQNKAWDLLKHNTFAHMSLEAL